MRTLFAILMLFPAHLWAGAMFFNQSHPSAGVIYYVDTSGSDANTGLIGHPWQHVGYALSNAASGSTVLLTSGQTFSQDGVTFVRGPMVVGTSSSGAATIQGMSGSNVLYAVGISSITVENLNLFGGSYSNTQACVQCYSTNASSATNWTITGCTMSNAQYGALFLANGGSNNFDFFTFTFNSINLVEQLGVFIRTAADVQTSQICSNATLANNSISNVLGDPLQNSGTGIGALNTVNLTCYSNVIHDCGINQRQLLGGAGAIVSVWGNHTHYWQNTCYNMWQSGGNGGTIGYDGGGFDFDTGTSNSVCEGCFAYQCQGPGYYGYDSGGNNIYRWNVGIGDGNNAEYGELCIFDQGTAPALSIDYIYNNTFWGYSNAIRLYQAGGLTNYVVNNILAQFTTNDFLISCQSSDLNHWHFAGNEYLTNSFLTSNFQASWPEGVSNYFGITQWRSVGQEIGTGLVTNGGFVIGSGYVASNYYLLTNSPLLAKGLDVHGIYGISAGTMDYYGNSVSSLSNNVGGLVGSYPPPTIPGVVVWLISEGTGSVLNDSSGNGYTGTLFNSPVWGSGMVGGNNVNYLTFTAASSQYAQTSASSVSQMAGAVNASISGWINPSVTAGGMFGFSKINGYRFEMLDDFGFIYVVCEASGSAAYGYTTAPLSSSWHFVVITFDGSQGTANNRAKLYVDGVLQTLTYSGTFPTALDTAANLGPFGVGTETANGYYMNGSATDVRISNSTLSQGTINALYAAGPQ